VDTVYPRARHLVKVGLLRSAVVAGFTLVLTGSLELSPGAVPPEPPAAQSESLPWDTALSVERRKATLVLVLDAGEPSAEMSLAELRRTIVGREETVVAHVVFVVRDDEFVARSLWGEAASIPGVHVLRDAGGVEAARLAATSGTAVLYRPDRRLLFRGASMQELPPLLDRPTTDTVAPPRRRDAAHRRPGPLDDWIEPDSSDGSTL
jgi:hypothetical protein